MRQILPRDRTQTDPADRHRIQPLLFRALVILGILAVLGLGGMVAFVYLFPEKVARSRLESWRRSAAVERKEIALPAGLNFAYLDGGTGEPLVLLHGFGADKDNFTAVARFLTPHYRVIVPDLPGFGESSRPEMADYTPPVQVERLHALIKALGLGPIHLGGSSMSGQIALTYAARYSNEIGSLWLIAPAGVWSAPKSELLTRIAAGKRNLLLVKTEDEFDELFTFVMSKPPYLPRPVLGVLARDRIRHFELEQRILAQILSYGVEGDATGLATPA